MKLTQRQIDGLEPGGARRRIADDDQSGLYLTVGSTSKVFWFKRRNRWVRVGACPAWTLAAARARARELVVEDDQGRPLGLTVKAAFERWKSKPGPRSPATLRTVEGIFNKHFAEWHHRPLHRLTRSDLVHRHDQIARASGPQAAKAAMRAFSAWWRLAMQLDPKLPVPPTVAVQVAVRSQRDVSDLYGRLDEWRGQVDKVVRSPVRRSFYLFALFTGMRSETICKLRWEDVAPDSLLVREPKRARGKEPKPYTIPLTEFHHELLAPMRGLNDEWVFPGLVTGGPLPEPGLTRGERKDWKGPEFSPHALRHCFVSAGVEAGVHPYALSLLVNHRIGGTAGIYVSSAIDTRPAMEAIVALLRSKTE